MQVKCLCAYAKASATRVGLKTWKQAPEGKILKSDVTIAKNYLNEEQFLCLRQN